MSKILVVGSSNTNMVVKSSRLPVPGEAILDENFLMGAGGKVAIQGIVVTKLGEDVTLVVKIGKDIFAKGGLADFYSQGINNQFVINSKGTPSGGFNYGR